MPGDPAISVASNEKARQMLGWTPQRADLADIIGDMWNVTRPTPETTAYQRW
ncbi:hypothetical protein ACWDUL_20950 [Nocardia niigatensis]